MLIKVYLDESGNIHENSKTNFFVIGGYFTYGNNHEPEKIKNKYKSINRKQKKKRNLEMNLELKTRDMSVDEKIQILTNIQKLPNFYGCAILFDKIHMMKQISNCNIFFNFGVKLLFEDVILKMLPEDIDYDFDISIDNRNISVSDLKDLEKYLNTNFCYSNTTFKVKYYDSSSNYGIQLADFVANTMYMRSKSPELINEVVNKIDKTKFRLGIFPGKNYVGKGHKIEIEFDDLEIDKQLVY